MEKKEAILMGDPCRYLSQEDYEYLFKIDVMEGMAGYNPRAIELPADEEYPNIWQVDMIADIFKVPKGDSPVAVELSAMENNMNKLPDLLDDYPDPQPPKGARSSAVYWEKQTQGPMNPNVYHPLHYNIIPGVECIDVTRHMNFNRGNAVKYIWRAGSKGREVEDLEKAIWYLEDEIKRLQLKGKL